MLITKVVEIARRNKEKSIIIKQDKGAKNEIMVKRISDFRRTVWNFRNSFIFFRNGKITDILFLLFIALIFLLCLGKTPKFLSEFIHKYPRISYYLTAIGWVSYFLMVAVAIILGIGFLSGSLEHLQENVLYGTAYFSIAHLGISGMNLQGYLNIPCVYEFGNLLLI